MFRGAPAITIPPGEMVLTDPLDYHLPALTNLAITIYFGNISATTINGHPGSRTTSFIQSGNVVAAASLPTAAKTQHWYILTGIEVLADVSSKTLVTLGDSITDGRGSTTDGNDRWPDTWRSVSPLMRSRPAWPWSTWALAAAEFTAGWDRRR